MTDLELLSRGKVRDIYRCGDGMLLMVASDRISAFDVVLDEAIPQKGRVLTSMSTYWMKELREVAPNHLVAVDPESFPDAVKQAGNVDWSSGRAMVVRQAEMLPVECIVRGFLAGSAWKEYSTLGTIHKMPVPAGLELGSRLPEPLFTPSTKATTGHDENISYNDMVSIVGEDVADEAKRICLDAYSLAAQQAQSRGFLVADTKFELGFVDGVLTLSDEVLTPDSSRFWKEDDWQPGTDLPSYDKQPVRDWLESTGWNKVPPPPSLPEDVVESTSRRYITAYEDITLNKLDDWYGA
ncbi:MAG: phosphoribosylaminoimidazolesuccinocarboxamide synthase [Actinobacteria bacterium]|nr:phosphoribosylaminoimidazolesuccinocarboxamide synthase [Actinomycetota bacterium]MCL5885646.1 phosphoribosylaminoimidazolesuccinocarboxamide synthase [Actinomycetota bacterium]